MDNRIFKFIIVGIANTVFGYSIYALFIFFDFNIYFSLLISNILGIIFNYNTFKNLVFSNSGSKNKKNFILIYVMLYLINISLLSLIRLIVTNVYIGQLLLLAPLALLSFYFNSRFVFNKNV
jgi:putative flippase GtrA